VTKFDHRTQEDLIEGLDTEMASDLQDLYAAPVPAIQFQPTPAAPNSWLSQLLGRTWRPAAAVAATGIAVATVLVGPSLWSGESPVNAETILARTSAAAQSNAPAAGRQSYHLVATTESDYPEKGSTATTTEVWYVDATHQRTESEYTGDSIPDFGVSVDGADAWMFGAFGGEVRAVHGPASELGISSGGKIVHAVTASDVCPSGSPLCVAQSTGSSLSELLSQYTAHCQKAEQDGEDTIAGRTAYRIVVTPDVATCPAILGDPGKDIGKLGTLILDVDEETFLPLKMEQQDNGGGPAYTYTVTQIQVGGDIPGATFTYAAPAGVTVVDVADLTQAKNILSGYSIDGTAPDQPGTSVPDQPSLDIKPTPAP
jgi:outer membrane lipoprotein-sorting protein